MPDYYYYYLLIGLFQTKKDIRRTVCSMLAQYQKYTLFALYIRFYGEWNE